MDNNKAKAADILCAKEIPDLLFSVFSTFSHVMYQLFYFRGFYILVRQRNKRKSDKLNLITQG
jgi:hypothetical protein